MSQKERVGPLQFEFPLFAYVRKRSEGRTKRKTDRKEYAVRKEARSTFSKPYFIRTWSSKIF
jgi:hypothetical protein